ncbi:hypothetical protein ATSB10_05920 [Dyella thiooxydans]|uniref:Uncharacterized protein n=1 Tax=Dyella thiooxydans TaxID=445710 RepID=A0A160MXW5_9GAMM|nr:hypothetical protein ATSB10_05920 [Dyella thiooxydans]
MILLVCSAVRDMSVSSSKANAKLAQRHHPMTLRKLRLVDWNG